MTDLGATDLPVAGVLAETVEASRRGAVVLTAPPGSGKTMLVPAAILDDLPTPQRVVLVQPRRLAARAVARRIAQLRGGELGQEVGYQVRFDSCVSRQTRLVVVTTGILLRRLLDDPALDAIGAVVLDEFHERTVEMDLALGMLVRVRQTLRPELRLLAMSATLAPEALAALLDPCTIVHAEGRRFPVAIRRQKRGDQRPLVEQVATAAIEAWRETAGHVLAFLPGVGEIQRCREALDGWAERADCELLPLFGDLPPEQQDRALADVGRRKLILATNVAETSLTIEGVTAVVDSGLARQLRVAPATGLPRLELTPISQASAEQRAGRAGRTAPGVCWQLWDDGAHRARPDAELPEILRSDLAEPLLQLAALGEGADFPWLDPPPPEAVANSQRLLQMLGAIDGDGRITPLGEQLARLPAHPRLGRLLMAGAALGVLRETTVAAALLPDPDPFRAAEQGRRQPRDYQAVRSRSDVVDRVLALQLFHGGREAADPALALHPGGARNVLRAAEQLYRLAEFPMSERAGDPAVALEQALLAAFPDRLVRMRGPTDDRGVMVGGRGVRLDGSCRVRGASLLLAIDLSDAAGEARVRLASAVERDWLPGELLAVRDELFFNPTRGQVEARRRTYWFDLMLDESPGAIVDVQRAAELLYQHALPLSDRLLPVADTLAGSLLARTRWLSSAFPQQGWPTWNAEQSADLLRAACDGKRSLDELRRTDWLPLVQQAIGWERLAEAERLAPAALTLANGNRHPLAYEPGRPPVLAVRIQELFGQAETPRIADGRTAVLLHLLGPNHRPQQVTADLASFWKNTYPEVRKELRRRYPKHDWPDDPLAASATRSGLKRDSRREAGSG